MARLISSASGNLTAAGTWSLVDPTSLFDSETNFQPVTLFWNYTQTFTPGAITIDGIAVHIASRVAAPTGTVSVALYNGAIQVAGTLVTINHTDINLCDATYGQGGWYLFKFAAPVVLAPATAYRVGFVSSVDSQVQFYRDSVAANVSRMLRTTTNQAPAVGDLMDVMGEHTGAGTGNNFTVTMDSVVNTDYGAITVSARSTMTFGVAAATNYILRSSGVMVVGNGGTLNIGTVVNPMPADSTGFIEFDCTSDGEFGLRCGGTLVIQGAAKTGAALLNGDILAGVTTATLNVAPSGWRDNDNIVIAPTTRTNSQYDAGQLNGLPVGAVITFDGMGGVGGSTAYAHTGTFTGPNGADVRAEVINYTRNVGVRAVTSTLVTYVNIVANASVDVDNGEFYYLGENVDGKRGFQIRGSPTNVSVRGSSFHHTEDYCVFLNGCIGNLEFVDIVLFMTGTSNLTAISAIQVVPGALTSTNTLTVTDITSIYSYQGGVFINLGSISTTSIPTVSFARWRIAGSVNGYSLTFQFALGSRTVAVNLSDVYIHSSSNGASFTDSWGLTVQNIVSWCTNGTGVITGVSDMTFVNPIAFGNSGLQMQTNTGVRIINPQLDSWGAYTAQEGLSTAGSVEVIGGSVGVYGTFSLNDIGYNATGSYLVAVFYSTRLGSATKVKIPLSTGVDAQGRSLEFYNFNNSPGDYRRYTAFGTIFNDTTIRHTASGYSWRVSPMCVIGSSKKMVFPGPFPMMRGCFTVVGRAATPVTISAWIYKDALYAGNQPRLVVRGGITAGIPADVIATMTVGATTWEQLSSTVTPTNNDVIQFYVDCDGITGNIYVDDISVTMANGTPETGPLDIPDVGSPVLTIYNAAGSGASGGGGGAFKGLFGG